MKLSIFLHSITTREYIFIDLQKSYPIGQANAQESLEFDTDIGSKYDQIKYIQFRYKDIAECKFIDKDIQDRAKDIYEQIQTVLDELQIS